MTLNYINDAVNKALKHTLRQKGSGNLISKLHPDINTRLNSLNTIVGHQNNGKTVVCLQEIIKVSHLENNNEKFHLLIYVTKNGDENDMSFQALKHLIKIPYICVSEDKAEDVVKTVIAAKNLYYLVKREGLEEKIDDDQKADLFDTLHIEDFEKNFIHTILLFDDIANSILFKSESSYFSLFIKRLRHYNFVVYLLFQNWKGIKPFIKSEISCLYVFPGFNSRELSYIYSQSASSLSSDEFRNEYYRLNNIKRYNVSKYPYILVDVVDGGKTKIIEN